MLVINWHRWESNLEHIARNDLQPKRINPLRHGDQAKTKQVEKMKSHMHNQNQRCPNI